MVVAVVAMRVFSGSVIVENLEATEHFTGGVDMMVRILGDDVIAVVLGGDRSAALFFSGCVLPRS